MFLSTQAAENNGSRNPEDGRSTDKELVFKPILFIKVGKCQFFTKQLLSYKSLENYDGLHTELSILYGSAGGPLESNKVAVSFCEFAELVQKVLLAAFACTATSLHVAAETTSNSFCSASKKDTYGFKGKNHGAFEELLRAYRIRTFLSKDLLWENLHLVPIPSPFQRWLQEEGAQ